ncbi:hypothetical protein [Mesorhizobium sp. 1B3]|uniref:hypothetical protein n=1 Tax=Mesorhizobium sp. 1B3 TaxID=3243599 RepID=UPI003D98B570
MARAITLFGTVSAAALALSVHSTAAQGPSCGPYKAVVKSLAEQYREKPQSVGVIDNNTVLEVFVSDAGTWTIVVTDTAGRSCVLSAGEGWDNNTVIASLPKL